MTAYLLLASGRDCNPHTYPVSDEAEKVVVGEGARECYLHYSLPPEHILTFRQHFSNLPRALTTLTTQI